MNKSRDCTLGVLMVQFISHQSSSAIAELVVYRQESLGSSASSKEPAAEERGMDPDGDGNEESEEDLPSGIEGWEDADDSVILDENEESIEALKQVEPSGGDEAALPASIDDAETQEVEPAAEEVAVEDVGSDNEAKGTHKAWMNVKCENGLGSRAPSATAFSKRYDGERG